ncbi:MAG TPA: O-antigen ligase family protein, partial [Anaerolinea sp.]|nr:O-antigen ligase family protein [Anaerolinea sp.]
DLRRTAWMISLPLVSILSLAAYATLTAQAIRFTTDSNFLTSGGFGPNQVSAVLGLGVVMMILYAVTVKNQGPRTLAILIALGFGIQSALTFSRGGLYNAAICIFLAAMHLARNRRSRLELFVLLTLLSLVTVFWIYPQINRFTGGILEQRFADTEGTGRVEIAQAELRVWQENPLWGVGPGISPEEGARYTGFLDAAHTEYTRLLAEHGIFGLLALFALLGMAAAAYLRAPNWIIRAWVVAMVAWPFAEMAHAAMRIVAISFLFGISVALWKSTQGSPGSQENLEPVARR